MICRTSVRTSLVLLVTAAQVIGTVVAIAPVHRPDSAIYFCCCIGECSCTGDCCNHAPENGAGSETPVHRVGAAGTALDSPRGCGIWRATLQRGPDQDKMTVDDQGNRFSAPSSASRLQRLKVPLVTSLKDVLRLSSPRAPPQPSA